MRSPDERFMRLALLEARRGLGRTHPNPAVGAVVVKAGRVVARAYHQQAGAAHAEARALALAGPKARGATLYSTLEPCDHFGRTPPCTEAILRAGVRRVVFASSDPNPLVNGKGLQRLRAAGVEVTAHVCRAEADALNQPFFKFIATGLPWVTLKAGLTLDGKVATASGRSKWITSPAARRDAHLLRAKVDAVVVGAGTVRADDPRLTARVPGGRSPVRVVLDARLATRPSSRVYDCRAGLRTLVATALPPSSPKARALARRGVELLRVPARGGRVDLRALLRALAGQGLLHVLVEGGATVHGAFLAAGLVDELRLYVAPKLFGHAGLTFSGALAVASPRAALAFEGLQAVQVGPDLLLTARAVRGPRRRRQGP